jgi:hypothetical protein
MAEVGLEAPDDLVTVSGRIHHDGQLLHMALGTQFGTAHFVVHISCLQHLERLLKGLLVGHFPTGCGVSVIAARLNLEAELTLIHLDQQIAIGSGAWHHAKHITCIADPAIQIRALGNNVR